MAMESLIESSRKILNHLMDYLQRAVFDCGNRVPIFSFYSSFFHYFFSPHSVDFHLSAVSSSVKCEFRFALFFIRRCAVPWSVFYADALWIQEKWYGQTFNFSCFMAVWLSKWKLCIETKGDEKEKVFFVRLLAFVFPFSENKKKRESFSNEPLNI